MAKPQKTEQQGLLRSALIRPYQVMLGVERGERVAEGSLGSAAVLLAYRSLRAVADDVNVRAYLETDRPDLLAEILGILEPAP